MQHVASNLLRIATSHGLKPELSLQAQDEGYYAAHLYVSSRVELPPREITPISAKVRLEIQITTQLKEVIGKLTHHYCEIRRQKRPHKATDLKWQWDYRAEEFSPNYLGHIVHYLEGLIIELRDRNKSAKGTPVP